MSIKINIPKREIRTVNSNLWVPRYETKGKIESFRAFISNTKKQYGEQAGIEAIREICKKDLFYLTYEILEYKDMVEPLHDDLCDYLSHAEAQNKSTCLLIPRGHFKSTIATVGRCIQWIIRDQNTSIGLFSGSLKNAKKFFTEIRTQLEQNETLKALFPEIFYESPSNESPKWTQDQIIVKRTEKGTREKEPTIQCFGLLQALPTGSHFYHLLGDDCVDQDIVSNEEQIEKVKNQIKYLRPLLKTPDDPLHFVGTRYHKLDPYQDMIDDNYYLIYLRRAVEEGKLIFPERFTQETLNKARNDLGNYIYNCQYMLEPMDPSEKAFKIEWLRYFNRWDDKFTKTDLNYYLIVDPANKKRKQSDFTAMMVIGIDHDWNWFMMDGAHDKLNPQERIDLVFHFAKKWRLESVLYEAIAFQDTDCFWIKRKMEADTFYFTIQEISHRPGAKHDAIMGVQPIYQSGKFHIPTEPILYKRKWENPDDGLSKTVDIVQIFTNQMDLYPMVVHDDMLDLPAMAREGITNGYIRNAKPSTEKRKAYQKTQSKTFNHLLA